MNHVRLADVLREAREHVADNDTREALAVARFADYFDALARACDVDNAHDFLRALYND